MPQTFSTIADLITYINNNVRTNGNQEISGEIENNVENGLANFILTSILNYGKSTIVTSGGVVILPTAFVVISGTVPTSIQWNDIWYNEYYIINATGSDIPLTSGYVYYDTYGTALNEIPARAIVHIVKTKNNTWVQANTVLAPNPDGLPPQAGHAGEFLTTDGTEASWGNLNIPGGPISTLPTVGYDPGTDISVQEWIINVFYRLAISVQPQSQTITEGNPVTFTVTAIGGTPTYTYQWKKNGTDITGATSSSYNIPTTTTGSAGNYTVVVTDSATNTVTSNTAVLTITGSAAVQFGTSVTDPYVDNTTIPVYTDVRNQAHVPNTNISVPFDANDSEKYCVLRTASTESAKTVWYNTPSNGGTIPDSVWRASFTIGLFTYYVSRVQYALDDDFPTIFS